MMMVVPSGTLSTSRPAATTTGMLRATRGWPRATWDSLREHDPGHQVGIQPGRLGGRQVARDEHTFRHRLTGGFAGQCAKDLVADGVDVLGALPQMGVRAGPPIGARRR